MDKQRGLTLIGLLFFLGLVIVAAWIGAKVVPAYMDYFTLRNMLENILEQDSGQANESLYSTFERRLDVNFIRDITRKDLVIERGDGMITLSVDINRKNHLVGGISLCVDLQARAEARISQ